MQGRRSSSEDPAPPHKSDVMMVFQRLAVCDAGPVLRVRAWTAISDLCNEAISVQQLDAPVDPNHTHMGLGQGRHMMLYRITELHWIWTRDL